MTTVPNLFPLFITLEYFDLPVVTDENWVLPLVEEFNNDIPQQVPVISSQNLISSNSKLVISSNRGLFPLEASISSDVNQNIEQTIDASHDSSRDSSKPYIDASYGIQTISDFSLNFEFTQGATKTFRNPFYRNPDYNLNNESQYNSYIFDLKRYRIIEDIPDNTLHNLTADAGYRNTVTADSINDQEFINDTFDASSVHAYKEFVEENNNLLTIYDEYDYSSKYWYYQLSLDKVPLGRLNYNLYQNDNLAVQFYTPSPYEGYFASGSLSKDMQYTSPESIGLGFLGSYLYGLEKELLLQAKHFVKFQKDLSKRELLPAMPEKVPKTWQRKNLTSNRRSLLSNSLQFIFMLSACINYADSSIDNPPLPESLINYIKESIKFFNNLIIPSDTLIAKGTTEEGFSLLDLDISANILFLIATSLYLKVDYNIEIHETAISQFITINEVVENSYKDILNSEDNKPLLALSLFWFFNSSNQEVLKKRALEDLNNFIDEGIEDELTLSLAWYTSQFFSEINTVNINTEKINNGVYKFNGNADLMFSTLQEAVNQDLFVFNLEDTINAEEFKFKLSVLEERAKSTIPIGIEWFTEKDIWQGKIDKIIKAFVSPKITDEVGISQLKHKNNIEKAKANDLNKLLESYNLKRIPFQSNDKVRDILKSEIDNRGSKENEIKNWLRSRLGEDFSISFNRIPDFIFDTNNGEVKVNSIDQLYQEVINVFNNEGEYGLYILNEQEEQEFIRWEDMVGTIDLEVKGYRKELNNELKEVIPAGVNTNLLFVLEVKNEVIP